MLGLVPWLAAAFLAVNFGGWGVLLGESLASMCSEPTAAALFGVVFLLGGVVVDFPRPPKAGAWLSGSKPKLWFVWNGRWRRTRRFLLGGIVLVAKTVDGYKLRLLCGFALSSCVADAGAAASGLVTVYVGVGLRFATTRVWILCCWGREIVGPVNAISLGIGCLGC